MKKILIVFLILSSVLFGLVALNFAANERMIHNYNNGIYKSNPFWVLGVAQPYVSKYNQGNICYKIGDYPAAVALYQEALTHKIPEKRECKVRINLALAMLRGLDVDEINDANKDEVLEMLYQARDVLTEKGCANKDDDNGHDQDAQQLKNEIDQLIQEIENAQNGSSADSSDTQDPQDGKQEESTTEEQPTTQEKSDLQQKYEQQQNDAQLERMRESQLNDALTNDYEYYDGKVW